MNQSIQKNKQGNQSVDVDSAVTKEELTSIDKVNSSFNGYSMSKFIPASGAATRMFKKLYTYLDDKVDNDFVDYFFYHIEGFSFHEKLKSHLDIEQLDKNNAEDRVKIIQCLLNHPMHYGRRPKALIKFHQYEEENTNPIDEHIYEGEKYLDADGVNLHFTIAPEHENLFNDYVEKVTAEKDHVNITYSFQKEHTNTMAVDMENEPFYLEDDEILYRPGGHGALLANLNDLEEDIIFIKNIDNVVHRSQVEDTIESKKMLASIGIEVKEQIDAYIADLLSGEDES